MVSVAGPESESGEESGEWVRRLRPDAPDRNAAIEELRRILVRGLSRSLAARGGGAAFAEDIGQEAVLKVMDSLDSFEGRSRFTTWAMTIATRLAISELRRRRFQDVSLEQIVGPESLKIEVAVDREPTAEETHQRHDLLVTLRKLIDTELTAKQREVLSAILGGVPPEEVARKTNSNRNAIYKLMYDSRVRLKQGFESAGYSAADILALLA